MTWQPETGGRQHRSSAIFQKAFLEEACGMLSWSRQKKRRHFLHILKISRKFAGESVVLLTGRKSHCISSCLALIIWRLLISVARHILFMEGKERNASIIVALFAVLLLVYGNGRPSLPIYRRNFKMSCRSTHRA